MNYSVKLFSLSLLLCLLIPVGSRGAEQRCNALGANCICSEPLNTNVMPKSSGYYNPGDTTTLECTSEGSTGYMFYRANNDVTAAGAGSAPINALPSRHTVSYVWRGPDGHESGIGPESVISLANLKQNMAARWYMYISPDWNYTGEAGGCHRAKWFFLNTQAKDIAFYMTSEYGLQNWLMTNLNLDCCNSGPFRPGSAAPSRTSLKGIWTRFELVIQNTNQNGVVIELFMKRLGLDTAERSVIYTGVGSTDPHNYWNGTSGHPTATEFTNMRLSKSVSNWQFRKFAATAYGEALGGTCLGYAAFTHFMVAGWDGAYAGQRIGPASEIEGAQGVGPSAPPNVRTIP